VIAGVGHHALEAAGWRRARVGARQVFKCVASGEVGVSALAAAVEHVGGFAPFPGPGGSAARDGDNEPAGLTPVRRLPGVQPDPPSVGDPSDVPPVQSEKSGIGVEDRGSRGTSVDRLRVVVGLLGVPDVVALDQPGTQVSEEGQFRYPLIDRGVTPGMDQVPVGHGEGGVQVMGAEFDPDLGEGLLA